MQREDLIKLAREAVTGSHVVGPDGSMTKLPEVLDPASFVPPEWVLEAMQRAYKRGAAAGRSRAMDGASENTERG